MTTVDELFDSFRAAYRAGEDADPRRFLAKLTGTDRRELEALIDGFLASAPGDPYEPEAFERFRAQPSQVELRERISKRLAAEETWATLLANARDDAKIPRSALIERLAAALGVSGRESKVAHYYHRMELGSLPARGVSGRVLAALAEIVGIPVERLRAAGERLAPPGAGAPAQVFARTASPAMSEPPEQADAVAAAPPERPDEVDELFTGGS